MLTPQRTLALFVQQIAHGNIACAAMRHLAGTPFSDSAWCQARSRLPIEFIAAANQSVIESLVPHDAQTHEKRPRVGEGLWRGHRVCMIDGTNDSMPDTPELRSHYGIPPGVRAGLGFPTSHLLMRMDHDTGLILDCIDGPMGRSDLADTPQIHAQLGAGDIVLADVAFSGYAHIALILRSQSHVVMPVHHRRIIDFSEGRAHAHPRKRKSTTRTGKPRSRVIRRLGRDDQIVDYFKPTQKPAWMSQEDWAAIPDRLELREIRRTCHRHGFRPIVVTIVTSLLDAERYPADELIELRLTRWLIETNFRHLKITLGMDVLKCKTVQGVRKERVVFILVYNLIRVLMSRMATRRGVNSHRISFADGLAWVRFADHVADDDVVRMALLINPIRDSRLEPRVLKRGKKGFACMTIPRSELKSQLRARQGVPT